MSHYHDAEDRNFLREVRKLAPNDFKTFVDFDNIIGKDDGAIPRKYRELMAIALAVAAQCPYCMDAHTRAARKAGVTREEVAEATLLAAALQAGAAATHGALAMKLFDQHDAATSTPATPSSSWKAATTSSTS